MGEHPGQGVDGWRRDGGFQAFKRVMSFHCTESDRGPHTLKTLPVGYGVNHAAAFTRSPSEEKSRRFCSRVSVI